MSWRLATIRVVLAGEGKTESNPTHSRIADGDAVAVAFVVLGKRSLKIRTICRTPGHIADRMSHAYPFQSIRPYRNPTQWHAGATEGERQTPLKSTSSSSSADDAESPAPRSDRRSPQTNKSGEVCQHQRPGFPVGAINTAAPVNVAIKEIGGLETINSDSVWLEDLSTRLSGPSVPVASN